MAITGKLVAGRTRAELEAWWMAQTAAQQAAHAAAFFAWWDEYEEGDPAATVGDAFLAGRMSRDAELAELRLGLP